MEKQAYDRLFEVEDQHWYNDACKKLVEYYLKQIKKQIPNTFNILEVGCGTGGMLSVLRKYGRVTGLELSDYAITLCRKKNPEVNLINGSANNLKLLFKDKSFDVVAFFNVLYHKDIENEIKVLKEAYDILKPSGYIILYEPAFKCLYRRNDRMCHGKRRYSRNDIKNILESAGFILVKSTYFNAISFLPVLGLKLIEQISPLNGKKEIEELKLPPNPLNNILKWMMSVERIWINLFKKMPFGVSILCIGKKVA